MSDESKLSGFAEEVDRNIGRNLRAARERQGVSQAELARLVSDLGIPGVHQTTIARIERGSRSLRAAEAIAVCRALEVTLEYLAESAATASLRSHRQRLAESVGRFREALDDLIYQRWNVAHELDARVPHGAGDEISIGTALQADVDMAVLDLLEVELAEADPQALLWLAYWNERHSGRIGYAEVRDDGVKTRLNFLADEMKELADEVKGEDEPQAEG